MTEIRIGKSYDLEERTLLFAKNVALFCSKLTRTATNIEYAKQLIRSSGSVGANYIEANEALGRKDFVMRVKICRKESKESTYWLKLIMETSGDDCKPQASVLIREAEELKRIFSSIVQKTAQTTV